jgi:hypothetical protein
VCDQTGRVIGGCNCHFTAHVAFIVTNRKRDVIFEKDAGNVPVFKKGLAQLERKGFRMNGSHTIEGARARERSNGSEPVPTTSERRVSQEEEGRPLYSLQALLAVPRASQLATRVRTAGYREE